MQNQFSRRGFIKTAGAASTFMIAAGNAPFSYAANERVRVGCIGVGGQGTFHITDGLAGTQDIEIVAICDVLTAHREAAAKIARISNANILLGAREPKDMTPEEKTNASAQVAPPTFAEHQEMLDKVELDAVVIATPLTQHVEPMMNALDAGKYVFCEKTIVFNVEDGRNMIKKCHDTGKFVQVGHQRRYNPKYNLAMAIAFDYGKMGRINHITAQWHRNHFWRRNLEGYGMAEEDKKYVKDLEHHLNWRMYSETSGGLYTELSTHQTDIANWFMKKVPSRVYSTGGTDYWRDNRTVDDNIVLVYEYDQRPSDPGFVPIDRRSKLQNMAKINGPYTVRFVYTSILANAKRGASEMMQGDYGTLELTEQKCYYYAEPDALANLDAASDSVTSQKSLRKSNKELVAGEELLSDKKLKTADNYQFEAFAHHIKNGGTPQNNQMVGFTTAITALTAIESREKGAPVEIDPASYTFDFEVPSFYDYHFNADDYPTYTEEEIAAIKAAAEAAAKAEEEAAAKAAEEAAAAAAPVEGGAPAPAEGGAPPVAE